MTRYGLLGSKVCHNNRMYFFVTNIQHIRLYVRDSEYIEYDGVRINTIGTINDIEAHVNSRRRTMTIRFP